jgi:hypothetical protein
MKQSIIFIIFAFYSFQIPPTLKGTWKFAGGIYNGKKEDAPTGYMLQRVYDATRYQAFALEKGYKPEKYETGTYLLRGDTCIDTEIFCSQPSKITNIPVHYLYTITHDTLVLKGTLPTGMTVEEYWRKVK